VYLDDITIIRNINSVISNPMVCTLQGKNISSYTPTSNITRLTNDVNRMLEQTKIEFMTVANSILECASEKFDCCNIEVNDELTQLILEMFAEATGFNEELIAQTVDQIIVNEDGKIKLLVKSGVEIKGDI